MAGGDAAARTEADPVGWPKALFGCGDLSGISDAFVEQFVRQTCKTVYHPVDTCRMGTDPASSVVDLQLRVHGIDGLRVVDCSTFPAITSGNTNAPTIAVAEKAADLIVGDR